MVKPSLKVGIIEPTNLVKLSTLTGKPQEFFIDRAAEIGKALAESCGLTADAESADHLRKEPNWFLANYKFLCQTLSAVG